MKFLIVVAILNITKSVPMDPFSSSSSLIFFNPSISSKQSTQQNASSLSDESDPIDVTACSNDFDWGSLVLGSKSES